MAGKGGANMRWDSGVGHDEGLALVRAQGDLVKKDDDVRQNEKSVDDRVGAPRVQVFDGDEHAMESSADLWESGPVAASFALKSFNFFQSRNSASSTECFAVQTCGGARESENALQLPAVQDAVREPGMKNVASASGVGDAHFVGGRIPETKAVPSQGAINAKRGTDGAAAEPAFEEGKGFQHVGFAGSRTREVARRDGIIHEAEKRREIGRPTIEIGDDRNFGGASPGGGLATGSDIASIHVQ